MDCLSLPFSLPQECSMARTGLASVVALWLIWGVAGPLLAQEPAKPADAPAAEKPAEPKPADAPSPPAPLPQGEKGTEAKPAEEKPAADKPAEPAATPTPPGPIPGHSYHSEVFNEGPRQK